MRIIGRDVLHNFYLPHFRVKMDAVPGIPTYFVFTPIKTTQEYREELSQYPEYQVLADPAEPDGPQLWEVFEYELACAELCGSGHFSMRRVVRIVSEEEYQQWLVQQSSYYLGNIRNGDEDPLKGQVVDLEVKVRGVEFSMALKDALAKETPDERIVKLNYINFETGSSTLTPDSRFELENLATALKENATMTIEVSGHTDNVGEAGANLSLSQARANGVVAYLVEQGVPRERLSSKGYGQTKPLVANDTEENRAQNRRTEFKILSK